MLDDMPFIDVRPVGTPELQGAAAMLRRFGDQDTSCATGAPCRAGRRTGTSG